jgi:hypothetical protein
MKRIYFVVVLSLLASTVPGAALNRPPNGGLHLQRRQCNLTNNLHKLAAAPVSPTVLLPHNSELTRSSPLKSPMLKVNSLMLLFYASLGAVMPYIPLYYRKLGVSGAFPNGNAVQNDVLFALTYLLQTLK